jgi:hypothetical protein
MAALIAGFAAQDLPVAPALHSILLGVALVAALTCFTQAGKRSKALLHRSQLTGRFWAVVGGFAIAFGALTLGGIWLVEQIDLPIRHTLLGVLVVALIAVTQPLYRVSLHRTTA